MFRSDALGWLSAAGSFAGLVHVSHRCVLGTKSAASRNRGKVIAEEKKEMLVESLLERLMDKGIVVDSRLLWTGTEPRPADLPGRTIVDTDTTADETVVPEQPLDLRERRALERIARLNKGLGPNR